MGHLVNPISLRLKKHGIWQVSWNAFFKKDYIYFFFINRLLEQILNSFINLKCLKKKFIFFEIKYFLKNNKLIIFLGFKFIKKSRLKLKKLNLFKKKLTYILKKQMLKLKLFYKYFNIFSYNHNNNYDFFFKNIFFYKIFLNYNFKQLKRIYLLKIKQIKAFSLNFINTLVLMKLREKALICLIFNKYILFNCLKLYTNSLLLKLMTNSFIPFTKNLLNVYTFKRFLVNGMNEFVINFNNNELVYNFTNIYLKFLLKLNYYKHKALYFYKNFFIYYHERFKYKINKYKSKLNKFKNNIYFNCKLWKKKFNNLLLDLCTLLI
jgi:hypothetical protein